MQKIPLLKYVNLCTISYFLGVLNLKALRDQFATRIVSEIMSFEDITIEEWTQVLNVNVSRLQRKKNHSS